MTNGAGVRRMVTEFISNHRRQGELASALRAERFLLHVQPEVDLASGRIVAAEALIRWNHLDRGLLLPAEFVPFAEEHGMLPSIGAWVIGEAIASAAALRAIDPSFRLWFNVSAPELGDPHWFARLARHGDSLRGLGVEITESVAMRDLP
ncbi:MAG TPA: EAL domain-containing protein, partial [Candidatus Elarobacter sp.]